ncbi:SMI1/KNR4 family protein [Actinokineospora terrae]|uniref:SMI1/KNR4 family protein n=1 Tax=Actinokineospora terrae TaxID=155974 RepID=UPI0011600EA7|nr:SMI1/KNR4 family protein [Actinokineospora terrae]
MRVVVAIFAIGGLLIAGAFALGVAIEQHPAGRPSAAPTPVDGRCRPPEGPLNLAEPDPVAAERVTVAWERVERWLVDNAAATSASWNAPASRTEMIGLQRDLGVRLPTALVVSLGRHDGVRLDGFSFPPAYQPLTVREIRTTVTEVCADPNWREGDVPFAKGESGNFLYLHDGAVYRYPAMQHHADDVVDLLDRTAARLEGANPAEYRPEVDALGRLRWVRE